MVFQRSDKNGVPKVIDSGLMTLTEDYNFHMVSVLLLWNQFLAGILDILPAY